MKFEDEKMQSLFDKIRFLRNAVSWNEYRGFIQESDKLHLQLIQEEQAFVEYVEQKIEEAKS